MTLKEAMVDDLKIFVNNVEFAVPAIYDGSLPLDVLFDLESDDNSESLIPVIRCAINAIPAIQRGKFFTIDGKNYGVINWYKEAEMMTIVCNEER